MPEPQTSLTSKLGLAGSAGDVLHNHWNAELPEEHPQAPKRVQHGCLVGREPTGNSQGGPTFGRCPEKKEKHVSSYQART